MRTLTLSDALTRKRLTPEALAELSGVSRATIYRLEGGYVVNPSHDTVKKLETALGLKPGTLVFHAREAA